MATAMDKEMMMGILACVIVGGCRVRRRDLGCGICDCAAAAGMEDSNSAVAEWRDIRKRERGIMV